MCDMRRRDKSHGPEYLNDYGPDAGLTWWQSDTMEFGVQYPNSVNITFHLGNLFFPLNNQKLKVSVQFF